MGEALDAVSSPMLTVGQKLQSMHIKETAIKIGVPASLKDLFSYSAVIEPDLDREKLTKVDLEKCTALKES